MWISLCMRVYMYVCVCVCMRLGKNKEGVHAEIKYIFVKYLIFTLIEIKNKKTFEK